MDRLKNLIVPALLGLAAYYALFGGQYSWLELREAAALQELEAGELEQTRREIDSLRTWVDRLENDDATLERLAREEYGMVGEGEVLYRFTEPETDAANPGGQDRR